MENRLRELTLSALCFFFLVEGEKGKKHEKDPKTPKKFFPCVVYIWKVSSRDVKSDVSLILLLWVQRGRLGRVLNPVAAVGQWVFGKSADWADWIPSFNFALKWLLCTRSPFRTSTPTTSTALTPPTSSGECSWNFTTRRDGASSSSLDPNLYRRNESSK